MCKPRCIVCGSEDFRAGYTPLDNFECKRCGAKVEKDFEP